jgi:hypothetical protein
MLTLQAQFQKLNDLTQKKLLAKCFFGKNDLVSINGNSD